jgi:hypothetical protein
MLEMFHGQAEVKRGTREGELMRLNTQQRNDCSIQRPKLLIDSTAVHVQGHIAASCTGAHSQRHF